MRYLAALAALALVLLAAGCTTQAEPVATPTPTPSPTPTATPSPTPSPSPTTVPTTVPTTAAPPAYAVELTIHRVSDYYEDNRYLQPGDGYRYVLADISVENIGSAPYAFTPTAVRLRTPDNTEYGYATVSFGVPGVFDRVTIPVGQTRRGKLVFEIDEQYSSASRLVMRID